MLLFAHERTERANDGSGIRGGAEVIDILLIVAVVFAPLLAVVTVIAVRPAGLAASRPSGQQA